MPPLSREARLSQVRFKRLILKDFPEEFEKRAKAVTEQESRRLYQSIRTDAPVSQDKDPGQLRDSVTLEIGEDGLSAKIRAGGATAPHATWVEFGTKENAAVPFFWPNVRLRTKPIRRAFMKALTDTMKAMQAKLS
jgi:hypothetical protein